MLSYSTLLYLPHSPTNVKYILFDPTANKQENKASQNKATPPSAALEPPYVRLRTEIESPGFRSYHMSRVALTRRRTGLGHPKALLKVCSVLSGQVAPQELGAGASLSVPRKEQAPIL